MMTAALSVWDADRRARTALATCRYEPWPARYWVQVAGTEITLYDVTRWQSRGDLTRIGFAVLGLLGVTVPYVRWDLQALGRPREAGVSADPRWDEWLAADEDNHHPVTHIVRLDLTEAET